MNDFGRPEAPSANLICNGFIFYTGNHNQEMSCTCSLLPIGRSPLVGTSGIRYPQSCPMNIQLYPRISAAKFTSPVDGIIVGTRWAPQIKQAIKLDPNSSNSGFLLSNYTYFWLSKSTHSLEESTSTNDSFIIGWQSNIHIHVHWISHEHHTWWMWAPSSAGGFRPSVAWCQTSPVDFMGSNGVLEGFHGLVHGPYSESIGFNRIVEWSLPKIWKNIVVPQGWLPTKRSRHKHFEI